MKKLFALSASLMSLITAPALFAQHAHAGHSHGTPDASDHAVVSPALPKQAQRTFDNYIQIQMALAQDKMQGVADRATAIAKAVESDPGKTLPAEIVSQAQDLAKTKDIESARNAFKALSNSLIKYLDGHKTQAGYYVKVFCPMADARWLQIGKEVKNPYFGKAMLSCGHIES